MALLITWLRLAVVATMHDRGSLSLYMTLSCVRSHGRAWLAATMHTTGEPTL